jgi:DNA-binding MarR family transcriptional regulator
MAAVDILTPPFAENGGHISIFKIHKFRINVKPKVRMNRKARNGREQQIIAAAREFSFSTVLFHHAVGDCLGVHVTDTEALALIVYRGVSTPAELASHTGLSSGAVTAMLDRLERHKLIDRRRNPEDRRSTLVVLAPGAQDRLEALFGPLRRAAELVVSTYSDADLDILAGFFEKLTTLLTEHRKKLQTL